MPFLLGAVRAGSSRRVYLGQELLHNLRAVVDGQDNVGDARSDESLDLVDNHGLVAELDERLGEGKGLSVRRS